MTRPIIKILFFSFILFFNASIFAQTISSIQIEGAKDFSSSQYLTWMNFSAGQKYFKGLEDSLGSRVLRGLKNEGYYHSAISQIDSVLIDSSNIKIIISVHEGQPTKINKFIFAISGADSVFVNRVLESSTGIILSQSNIDFTFSEILNHFENNSYPFAKINITSIYFIDDSTSGGDLADIYLSIDKGDESKIDLVEIEGNNKTKDYVIVRAAGIYEGENYNQELIDNIPDRLNRLRFFEPVGEPGYYFNSKRKGILKIIVKEKETNNFDGVFGYVPASGSNDKGFFTGYINISLRNLFGTGRSAAIRWQQENRNSQELELRYLEPWVFNYPFNIEASLFQRKQDSTYVQRTFEGKIEFIATQDISASAILNSQSTIPTERGDNIFTVFNSSALTYGINLKIDTRDDFYAPQKGIYLLNAYKFTSKSINGPAKFLTPDIKTSTTFQRLEMDFAYFQTLFASQVAALGIHARELNGNDVEISDMYFLGGTSSLRGYREKQFLGNRVLWSNLEYRYLLTKRSFAFLFFDTGYYLRNSDASKNINEISDFKIGYGFGLNIETGLGVLGISFALGKGDSFSDGKIHFGIINEF
jgi:outer membrane protein insertion porin family